MAFTLQKATLWKRFSAFLFDFILTAILSLGIMLILSTVLRYDVHNAELQNYYTEIQTKIEQESGLDLDFTDTEEYQALSAEEKALYESALQLYKEELTKNKRIADKIQTVFVLTLVILSVGLLIGILAMQFVIPLLFQNGQTLGKKIFGTALVRSNGVKVSTFVVFVRAIFGSYAIETLFPIALFIMMLFGLLGSVGTLTVLLLLGLQLGLVFFTANRTAIHDSLADTVVVDMATQRIFNTQEEMLEFVKKEKAEEAAQKRDYI